MDEIDVEIELLKKSDNFNKRAFFAMLNSEMKNIYNKFKGVGDGC